MEEYIKIKTHTFKFSIIEIEMETYEKNSNVVYKRGNTTFLPFDSIENLSKKRPSSTKLDLVCIQ